MRLLRCYLQHACGRAQAVMPESTKLSGCYTAPSNMFMIGVSPGHAPCHMLLVTLSRLHDAEAVHVFVQAGHCHRFHSW